MDKKTIIITGGAQGIGQIIAEVMLREGWNVVVWDYDQDAIQEQQQFYKNQKSWLGVSCDITSEEDVKMALALTLKQFGGIDALVNNAAIMTFKPISELEVSEWLRVIDVNLTGAFICVKYCEPSLKHKEGTIINMCSTRAFQSEANTEAYSASKGGIFALTHSLAVSLGPAINVNSISPGWIDVSSVRKSNEAHQIDLTGADHAQHPAGRVGVGNDIASMVKFLCEKENRFITGQNFTIDGGMTRKMIYL